MHNTLEDLPAKARRSYYYGFWRYRANYYESQTIWYKIGREYKSKYLEKEENLTKELKGKIAVLEKQLEKEEANRIKAEYANDRLVSLLPNPLQPSSTFQHTNWVAFEMLEQMVKEREERKKNKGRWYREESCHP